MNKTHQNKKINKRLDLSKKAKSRKKYKPPPIKPPRDYQHFKRIINHIFLLKGNVCLNDKKFGFISRNKQDTSACVVAPIYANLKNIKRWSSFDIDQILVIGDILYRTTISINNMKSGSIVRPNCIYPKFFVDAFNIHIFFDNEIKMGEIESTLNIVQDTKNNDHSTSEINVNKSNENNENPENNKNSEDNTKPVSHENLIHKIEKIFEMKNYAIIRFINGEYCLSIWISNDDNNDSNKKSTFIFCPYTINDHGTITKNDKGPCGIYCFTDKQIMYNFLCSNFKGKYLLYSMKLIKIDPIHKTPSIVLKEKFKLLREQQYHHPELQQKQNNGKTQHSTGNKPQHVKDTHDKKKTDSKSISRDSVLNQQEQMHQDTYFNENVLCNKSLIKLSQDYKQHSFNNNFNFYTLSAQGRIYVRDVEKILFTNISAAIHLHHVRSFLWTHETIVDILKFGKKLHNISDEEDVISNENWQDKILLPITFLQKSYNFHFKKIIYGEVITDKQNVINFHLGIRIFFEHCDVGLVFGPQNVLIWHEQNMYFMFDPKERDGLGRKWTRTLSSQLTSNEDNENNGSNQIKNKKLLSLNGGNACVTCHENLSTLADLYVSNIALKYRRDPYRIIRVRIDECKEISENIDNWIAYGKDKWINFGTISLCNYCDSNSEFFDKDRLMKSIGISIAALIYPHLKNELEWESNDINEIIKYGPEILRQSLILKRNKGSYLSEEKIQLTYDDIDFDIENVSNVIILAERKITLTILKDVIKGEMIQNQKNEPIGLKEGLEKFFKIYLNGVLFANNSIIPLWKNQGYYYMMYPYEKIPAKLDICICDFSDSKNKGRAFVLRLKTIDMIFKEIINHLNMDINDKFSITDIKILPYAAAERPPLHNYSPFTDNGAILRPFDNLHEGHEYFGLRRDLQTLGNLITALAFTEINSTVIWNKEDLVDILKIGDKMHCDMIKDKLECDINYKLKWDDVKLIKIGANNIEFDVRTEIKGEFKMTKTLESIIETKEEEQQANAPASTPPTVGDVRTTPEVTSAQESLHTTKTSVLSREEEVESKEEPKEKYDLEKLLLPWKNEKKVKAILESDPFSVAIWKEDGLYFIFDSKANDDEGKLTERRKQIVLDKIQERKDTEKQKESINESKQVVMEKLQDVAENENESKINVNRIEIEQQSVITKILNFSNVDEKSKYDDLSNDGSAYVAWFTELDYLIDHIFSKLPPEVDLDEPLTFHTITFINSITADRNNENMTSQSQVNFTQTENLIKKFTWKPIKNYHIIRGTTSQNDLIFLNRNQQELSNCIVSLGFAVISVPGKWTSSIIDIILKYGDRLYTKSLKNFKGKITNRSPSSSEYNLSSTSVSINKKLNLEDIIKTFSIYKIIFKWDIKNNFIENLVNEIIFQKFFRQIESIDNNIGVIINIKGYTNSIWKNNKSYYLFDPYETNPEGLLTTSGGFASIVKFASIDNLYEFLINKYGCIKAPNICEILVIEVNLKFPSSLMQSSMEQITHQELKPSQSMFTSYPMFPNGQVLRGFITEKPYIASSAIALATIVHTQLQCIEYWNTNIFNQIYFLGKYLQKRIKYRQLDNNEKNTNNVQIISVDDLDTNFTIDNILVHFVQNKVMQGFVINENITKLSGNINLSNALQLYFNNNDRGIITLNEFNVPIWKENNKYYVLYDDMNSRNLYVISMHTVSLLYEHLLNNNLKNLTNFHNIWYELRNIRMVMIPIKKICNDKILRQYNRMRAGQIRTRKEHNDDDYDEKDYSENNDGNRIDCGGVCDYCTECDVYDYITKKTKFSKKPKQNKPSGHYRSTENGFEVLLSNASIKRHKFFGTEDYFPSLKAACVIAAGMSQLKCIKKWSNVEIEKIIKTGISLYMDSVASKRIPLPDINELEQMIYLLKCWLQITVLPPTEELANKNDVLNILNFILQQHKIAYITTNCICLTIIRDDGCHLYLFDPGYYILYDNDTSSDDSDDDDDKCDVLESSRNRRKRIKDPQSARIFKFSSVNLLIDYVLKSIDNASHTIKIGPIIVFVAQR